MRKALISTFLVVPLSICAVTELRPDTAQWGVKDAWSLPIDVNKEGSLSTGVGDCEDYVLAKYAALHKPGCPTKTCAWC